MSTATATRPTLREVILDALNDAYWYRKSEVQDCWNCRKSPAGICADLDHQDANAMVLDYEAARKQIEGSLADPGTAGELAALLGTEGSGQP